MISNIDIIQESKFSWMLHALITKNTNNYKYIKEAIKDNSNMTYGIIVCNTLINITQFKTLFNKNKREFYKLCYNTIKGCIKINIEKCIWRIKHSFSKECNIVFE
jgi:hypothetical protein